MKNTSFLLLSFAVLSVFVFFAFAKPAYQTGRSYESKVVSAAVDNMNVFYMGLDNPLTVAIENYPCEKIELFSQSLNIEKVENGKYTVNPTRPGKVKIRVSGDGLPPKILEFRVKSIPNAQLVLSPDFMTEEYWKRGGRVLAEKFIQMEGVAAEISNFDFDAKCEIVSFELTRVAKNDDPVAATNQGGGFSETARRLINLAKAGDVYYFDNVVAKCPGDIGVRNLNSMVHKIK